MWKNRINKNVCMMFFTHILLIVLLCSCSSDEELYLLGRSEQFEKLSGKADGLAGAGGQDDADAEGVFGTEGTGSIGSTGGAAADEGAARSVIYVHVCGAVAKPGVVQIPVGSRAQAAVEAAGGFTGVADTAYVNLAAPIEDGEQLYIPTKEEAEALRKDQAAAERGIVNLNTADVRLLCTLPGIGESRAGDIIAYRQEHGDFTDTKEIMQVPGIKASTYEKIKDLIAAD